MPEDGKIDYLQDLISDAKTKGSEIINECGGKVIGTFMFPSHDKCC